MAFDPETIPPQLVDKLREARHVAILTGAGISAESGVPTFRDAQTGLWARYNPQELATPDAFMQNPRLVWDWYMWRKELVSDVDPNPGHFALVELERRVPQFTLITQNIDSLHQRAGSSNMIELHGSLTRTKCFNDGQLVEDWKETNEVPPRCPRCGGLLRPDVVWFGEMLPVDELRRATTASRSAELFLTIGTSGMVQPAASLPLEALEAGAMVIEINPNETSLSQWMTFSLRGPSGIILPALLAAAWPASPRT